MPIYPASNGRFSGMAWTVAAATFATSGDNTIVAAPGAGFRIKVLELKIQNETASATTSIIKWGSDTVARVVLSNSALIYQYSGPKDNEWVLPANTALIVNLSGANSHNYYIVYRIEAE